MLRRMRDFKDYSIQAPDGVIGLVKDFYFDDQAWVIRFFVVKVDRGEPNRQVLISPISIGRPNWEDATFPTTLTRHQINQSPGIDAHKSVSRQYEELQLQHKARLESQGAFPLETPDRINEDMHLRSANEIRNYQIHATDGDIGNVDGFLVDEAKWAIAFLIVNTSKWWIGHEVVVSPQSIQRVDWSQRTVGVDMNRDAIRHAPRYDAEMLPLARARSEMGR